MSIKPDNIGIMGDVALSGAAKLKQLGLWGKTGAADRAKLSGLSAGAQGEVDTIILDASPAAAPIKTMVLVVEEFYKNSTPLCKLAPKFLDEDHEQPNPDFGKFTEIDENGDDVIDGGTGNPNIAIDPATLS